MDQCDSLITKLITVLLDWYSGDIYQDFIFPIHAVRKCHLKLMLRIKLPLSISSLSFPLVSISYHFLSPPRNRWTWLESMGPGKERKIDGHVLTAAKSRQGKSLQMLLQKSQYLYKKFNFWHGGRCLHWTIFGCILCPIRAIEYVTVGRKY